MIFAKKRYVLFVGKHYIDPGLVVLKNEPLFYGSEAIPYTEATLEEALREIGQLSQGRKIRMILSEELVYVTEIAFPAETKITRELVREKAEASVPEDLRDTDWDFQTLRYAERHENVGDITVQVAVVEHAFSKALHRALQSVALPIESILPESYVLASLERFAEGLSVIVEVDREGVVFSAVMDGSVVATCVKKDKEIAQNLGTFLDFIAQKTGTKAQRIIFSHGDEIFASLSERFSAAGYECIAKDYNPLIGAVLQTKIAGRDEEVLNICEAFSSPKKHFWTR